MTGGDDSGPWLYQLMTWLSPAYPVGAYTYSHGLEWSVEAREVSDAGSLAAWLEDVLHYGAGRNDAILLAEAWRCADDPERLQDVADFGLALAGSKERQLEAAAQGAAFRQVSAAAWPAEKGMPETLSHAVAVGALAGMHAVPLSAVLVGYLHALSAILVSAGVRLIPLGQTDGQRIQAGLLPVIEALAREAANASLADVGGCCLRGDIAAMLHETQYTRLFRS